MEHKAHWEKKMLEPSAVTATILDAHNRYLDYEWALWFNIFRCRRYMGEEKQPRGITVFISAVGTQDWVCGWGTERHICLCSWYTGLGCMERDRQAHFVPAVGTQGWGVWRHTDKHFETIHLSILLVPVFRKMPQWVYESVPSDLMEEEQYTHWRLLFVLICFYACFPTRLWAAQGRCITAHAQYLVH